MLRLGGHERGAHANVGVTTLRLYIAAPLESDTAGRLRRRRRGAAAADMQTFFDCDHALFHFRCKELWADPLEDEEEEHGEIGAAGGGAGEDGGK